jgi:hypothetical protein
MQRISEAAYHAAKSLIAEYEDQQVRDWELNRARIEALREVINGKARTQDLPSRNKPLAPRKPAGSRAEGKPAKGGKPPRKVAHKG